MSALFVVLLSILFIGLKLGEVIAWSWIWVLSPLWISAALGLLVLLASILAFAAFTRAPRPFV